MSDDERAVLGDELQQRGDPQGELIALQLALAALPATAPPARRQLIERKIAAVLDRHHDALYGELAPFVDRLSRPDRYDPVLAVKQWDSGFADTVWIQRAVDGPDLVAVLRAMRALPITRFVRRIELGIGDHPAAIAELVREPPPSLRELAATFIAGRLGSVTSVQLRDTTVLEPLVPSLDALEYRFSTTVTALASPRLRRLALFASYVGNEPARLFDLELPALENLTCYGFLFDRTFVDRYPELREVTISARLDAGWFEHLVRSPMIERLESLAISILRDDDLRLIAEHRDRFAHMKRLDLTGNLFSAAVRGEVAMQLPPCLRYR